mmetsp:Transcript_40645/g.88522  ORF Transcript_40645/g.88522 Transcript_40645/m.88522 type:complete len:212 (-) Transcript_40645:581-1216(-)
MAPTSLNTTMHPVPSKRPSTSPDKLADHTVSVPLVSASPSLTTHVTRADNTASIRATVKLSVSSSTIATETAPHIHNTMLTMIKPSGTWTVVEKLWCCVQQIRAKITTLALSHTIQSSVREQKPRLALSFLCACDDVEPLRGGACAKFGGVSSLARHWMPGSSTAAGPGIASKTESSGTMEAATHGSVAIGARTHIIMMPRVHQNDFSMGQ